MKRKKFKFLFKCSVFLLKKGLFFSLRPYDSSVIYEFLYFNRPYVESVRVVVCRDMFGNTIYLKMSPFDYVYLYDEI